MCLCCCFSVLCGFTEVRRKKKGISFAQAWSVPQAMPILRTWPGRSLSASDVLPTGEGDGRHWAPLSDDEEDLKRYPVAGLVDDSGMAFGFVSSLPQSLLGSAATSLRNGTATVMMEPPSPQEPELTVWISRDGEGGLSSPGVAERTAVATGTAGSEGSSGRGAVVVGNNLHEPLILEDWEGSDEGDGARVGGVGVVEGIDAAEAGSHSRS